LTRIKERKQIVSRDKFSFFKTNTTRLNGTLRALFAVLCLTTWGCETLYGDDVPIGGDGSRIYGESCQIGADCRIGLICEEGACLARADQEAGGLCTISPECEPGFYCSSVSTCTLEGAGISGDPCVVNGDCQSDLYCHYRGFSGICSQTGLSDIGQECETTGDCFGGLGCGPEAICVPGAITGGISYFSGATCEQSDFVEGDLFQVYFEIPDTTDDLTEFYRLPFPNDIRNQGGTIDLSGHPAPYGTGNDNTIQALLDAIELDQVGFGLHQTTFFRFNAFPNPESIVVSGETPSLYVVNLDPSSVYYGQSVSFEWFATNGRGLYICNNWMGVRPPWDKPFSPQTTYAVILTNDIRGPNDETPVPSNDFTTLLNVTQPADSALWGPWETYSPLRDYLSWSGTNSATIAAATIFTTGAPETTASALGNTLSSVESGTTSGWILCDEETWSPCADDGTALEDLTRGCFSAHDEFYELQTMIEIPVFQEGTAPYLDYGGGVRLDITGQAIPQRTEMVCASLTIPKNRAMPVDGWPLVVYAHGTGENYRSQVDSLAGEVSSLGYASFGYDGVLHGPRRGDTLLSMNGFLDLLQLTPEMSPTGLTIRLNNARRVLIGHDQGANAALITLSQSDSFQATALSGAGGGVLLSLLEQTAPLNISAGVVNSLQESNLTPFHPVLNLFQMYFESVETLNYAPSVFSENAEGAFSPHLFMTWGVEDPVTPDSTIDALIDNLEIPLMGAVITEEDGESLTPPITGNLEEGLLTAAAMQFQSTGERGPHYVLFDNIEANELLLGFLDSLLNNEVPTLGTGEPVPDEETGQ
jgi:hypothetical protein